MIGRIRDKMSCFSKKNGRKWGYLAWRREKNGCYYISERRHVEVGFLFLIKATIFKGPVLCQMLYYILI